jgi:hypothetical protein
MKHNRLRAIHRNRFSKRGITPFILAFGIIGYLIFRALAAPNPNLPGDLNSDNTVNVTDLSILLSNYGTTNASADINNDGSVNVLDMSILLSNYGKSYSGGGGLTIPNNLGVMGQQAPSWMDSTKWRSDSASLISQLQTANTGGSELAVGSYGIAYFKATTSDPQITVTNTNGWGTNPGITTFRAPSAAKPAAGTDAHLAVEQPDGTVVEMWKAAKSGSNWTAGAVAVAKAGQYYYTIAGCRGSSLTLASGIVTPQEVMAGTITHVLAASIPQSVVSKSFVFPSYSSDGSLTGGIPEGARLVLDPNYDISSFTGLAREVAQALKTYGMIVVDRTGSDIEIDAQAPESWTALGQPDPWAAQSISGDPSLRVTELISHMKVAVGN